MSIKWKAGRLRVQTWAKALIGKGYFPKELPPSFTTEDLGAHAYAVLSDWEANSVFARTGPEKVPGKSKKTKKSGAYGYALPTPEAENLSCPKKGYERRNIHITHPVPQSLLSVEIAHNWTKIAKWVTRGTYSLDSTEISHTFSRALKPLNFEAHKAKKAYIEAVADWVVKTDVTRFYPSIYTHSITWAAYGKEKVKSSKELFKGSLADRLDILVRSCNRNQTIGIPVGPETSRIIADIISNRIECDFGNHVEGISEARIDRLQDDWYLGSPTLELAEVALSNLIKCYRAYELDLNGSKTAVERSLSPISETWIAELGAFLSHSNADLTRSRLRELLHLTLKLQLDYPKEPVVTYTLSVIESKRSHLPDVEALESFLMRVASIAPRALPKICSIFINLHKDTKRVSVTRVKERLLELTERALYNGNTFECLWLLYTLRGLGASINSKLLCSYVEGVHSSAIILVMLDLHSKGLVLNKLPIPEWENRISADGVLQDWTWLYAYEGIRHGWLKDKAGVMAEPFFGAMISRQIAFYDPRKDVEVTRDSVKRRSNQRKRNSREAQRLISSLRGFDFGEYAE